MDLFLKIIGVVFTLLTLFGGITTFVSSFNAKIASLEIKLNENDKKIVELSDLILKRGRNQNRLTQSIVEIKANEKFTRERLDSIGNQLLLQDSKYNSFIDSIGKMNATMVGLSENTKYIKEKIDLHDKFIMNSMLNNGNNGG